MRNVSVPLFADVVWSIMCFCVLPFATVNICCPSRWKFCNFRWFCRIRSLLASNRQSGSQRSFAWRLSGWVWCFKKVLKKAHLSRVHPLVQLPSLNSSLKFMSSATSSGKPQAPLILCENYRLILQVFKKFWVAGGASKTLSVWLR